MLGTGRYRQQVEIDGWLSRHPIARAKGRLVELGAAPADELQAPDARVRREVEEAAAYAEAGQPADPELAETLMFATGEA